MLYLAHSHMNACRISNHLHYLPNPHYLPPVHGLNVGCRNKVLVFRQIHTHHTCTHTDLFSTGRQSRTLIFDSQNKDVPGVKLQMHNLCALYDFSVLKRGPTPEYIIFFLFFKHTLIYARVGNLQPFAHIPKSRTVLVCNVVPRSEWGVQSMSSVDGAYSLTHTHTHTHTHNHMSYTLSWQKFW